MNILNKTTDIEKFLQFGNLTQPFLEAEYVLDKVICDYNAKMKLNGQANKLESLFLWIDKNVEFSKNKELIDKYKFQRTAKEIWESGFATGCTDYCVLFATFARQIGISTTFLHTAEKGWIERLKKNKDYKTHYGHAFCECFYNDKWILVDPTSKRYQIDYNTNLIKLNYTVGGNTEFVPYLRDLDLRVKHSVNEYLKKMEEYCINL
ncbi:MAG: transglutaminase domain-containing protein [Clostridia bacterium]|nr:transglutaminase domain-containing protein [Clostridia bacterium]